MRKQKLSALLWAAIPAGSLLLFAAARNHRSWMNFYVRHITTPYKKVVSALAELIPFGLAEAAWAGAILFLLWFVGRSLYLIRNSSQRPAVAAKRLFALGCIGLWIAAGYTALWGANYYADSFCDQTGLRSRGCSSQELYTLICAFADRASLLAEEMPRDEAGLYSRNSSAILRDAPAAYRPVCEQFPVLTGPERRPKPMVFSKIMSYLGFTGFYFPFTGESLVNVDQPRCIVPVTALHELCHQRNISSEEECNFLAVLAGMSSGDPEFEYSACLFAYIHLSNALYRADRQLLAQAYEHLSETAQKDNRCNSEYWAGYETPAADVGTTVYETFLQSYGQTDGMASYGKCVDLLVAYYFDYAPEAQFWQEAAQ